MKAAYSDNSNQTADRSALLNLVPGKSHKMETPQLGPAWGGLKGTDYLPAGLVSSLTTTVIIGQVDKENIIPDGSHERLKSHDLVLSSSTVCSRVSERGICYTLLNSIRLICKL